MLVPYTCCAKQVEDYYVAQAGNGMPYYQGMHLQKGYGIGGFFGKLFRTVLPFLKSGARAVGKEALRTGTMIANDVLAGKNLDVSAKTRVKDAGKILARKALKKADDMIGHGRFKRKRKTAKRIIRSKVRKVGGRDIFDS